MFRTTALRHARTAFPSRPLVRRWNHSKLEREAHYGFYDCPPPVPSAILTGIVSIQQPIGLGQIQNPFPEKAEEENEEREQQIAQMDEESGRTTGAGRPPTPVGGIIFGSRLAGPAAKPHPDPETIRIVEGIKVPRRPEEPDNCCMAGCVHCVWDLYREDIEDWQASRKMARSALKAKKKRIPAWLGGKAAQREEIDPLADIEPGLRAFMELEKALKERREVREHAA